MLGKMEPWRGAEHEEGPDHRQTCALSLDESVRGIFHSRGEKREGHSSRGDTMSQGMEVGQCH